MALGQNKWLLAPGTLGQEVQEVDGALPCSVD